MSFVDILSTVFEFILVGFTIWAVFHENKFIAFEERLVSFVKRRKLKVIKNEKPCKTFLTNN